MPSLSEAHFEAPADERVLIAERRIVRVVIDWCLPFPGYYP